MGLAQLYQDVEDGSGEGALHAGQVRVCMEVEADLEDETRDRALVQRRPIGEAREWSDLGITHASRKPSLSGMH